MNYETWIGIDVIGNVEMEVKSAAQTQINGNADRNHISLQVEYWNVELEGLAPPCRNVEWECESSPCLGMWI